MRSWRASSRAGSGFTTEFLRPYALAQLHKHAMTNPANPTGTLFPGDLFPPGAPRIIPDTYNAPGYPCLLAGWFKLLRPNFAQGGESISSVRFYSADRWIPEFNQIFLLLTALLIFILGHRLFDDRVAWMGLMAFLLSNMVWQYSLTALSTSLLMFLITAIFFVALEIYHVGETCFESNDGWFGGAWLWSLILIALFAAACLTRLTLLVLFVPLLVMLLLMPRANWLLTTFVGIGAIGLVAPWFWHWYQVSGNLFGSNTPLLLYAGQDEYSGNQIYCSSSIPSYEQLLKDGSTKEFIGFRWHFERAWDLLGSNPMVIFFAASILHEFKRRRAQALRWLIIGSGILLVGVTSLGNPTPGPIGDWNVLILLLPVMIVVGSAYFFLLLDRLNLHLWLLNNGIVIITLALTSMSMLLTMTTPITHFFNYPPYAPAHLNLIGQLARPDEWVTTDMPWATAWYSDRPSLWLPDSLTDFYDFHDNYCPTGVLLFTPVTTDAPLSNLVTGEYKEWLPLFSGSTLPPNFPLSAHLTLPHGDPEYTIWSDHVRW